MTSAANSPALRVLVAERHRTQAEALKAIIDGQSNVVVAATVDQPAAVVETARKVSPDVAVIDLEMSPDCSVVSGLHRLCPDTRIVVLADRDQEADAVVKALAAGAVGAIYKESSYESLARALEQSTRSAPVVPEEAAGILLGSYVDALTDKRERDLATISALAAAVEARDYGTGRHLRRVSDLACAAMEKIDPRLAQNEEVGYGFLLHDVGKVGIPDSVLNKPGPLGPEEWDTMRRHPEIGLRIVEPIGFSACATDVILCHHEQWNGGGYPNGLVREEIPVVARAFSVADAFDAMTSDRPYRPAMTKQEALEAIRLDSGTRFDPDVVDTFIDLVD